MDNEWSSQYSLWENDYYDYNENVFWYYPADIKKNFIPSRIFYIILQHYIAI